MTKNDVLEHGLRKALAALPLAALAVIALLAIAIRSEAGPGQLAAAATPEPDSALTQQCIEGAAVGPGNDGLASDCALLLEAKDTLRGTETLNWSADTAIASWEGITVGGSPLRATELVLDGWNSWRTAGRDILLNGTIPAALGGLSKLQRLTLSRNALTGTIPVELAHMSELASLQLYSNQLTGGIPPELGRLANLAWAFDLSRNQLSGSIPVELGKLSNLRTVRLQHNQLTGSIPAALGDLSNLNQLNLAGNTGLTGCIPESLRTTRLNDLSSLGLAYCTTTTTHTLTTSATGNGRITPLAGTYSYLDGASVTLTATPDEGFGIASWGGDCAASGTATTCTLTMDAARTASVTFGQSAHTLTVTVTGTGTVTPDGTTTQPHGDEVTLTASWDDATHSFTGWTGDCVGTASTCVVTMDADKTVTATFAALPADRCATPTAADCIRAVYLGTPTDYAQVADIPADKLLTPASDGRYHVERGQQYTVVTLAALPAGWTRFWLDLTPLEFGVPSSVSASQLIKPIGTTYTFTMSEDDDAAGRFTYDLVAAKPHPARPTHKPVLGNVVVTTVFQTPTFSYDSFDTTGAATAAGSYALLMPDDVSDVGDATTAVTTYEELRTGTTVLRVNMTDGDAKAQGGFYDTVEVDDLVEWRSADSCWMRMQVTEELTGTATTKQYAVKPYSYAYGGCTGTVPGELDTEFRWRPPNLGSANLKGAMMHGPLFARERTWDGTDPDYVIGTTVEDITWPPDPLPNPDLGPGWSGSMGYGYGGLEGGYSRNGVLTILTYIGRHWTTPERYFRVDASDQWDVLEFLLIDGHPAVLIYDIDLQFWSIAQLVIYDLERDIRYSLEGWDYLRNDPAAFIEIARKFLVIQ